MAYAALVTGADRGLGYSMCKALLKQGYMVFAGRFLPDYKLLDILARQYPYTLYPISMDVGSRESIIMAYDTIKVLTGHLDLVINNAAYMGGPQNSDLRGEQPIDYDLMAKSIRVNALGALQVAEIFLPLTDRGALKRLCFISSEVSSVNMMRRDGGFRYCVSKTALNMAVRILYNRLYPQGYTFRLYQPGWMRRVLPDGSRSMQGGADLDPDFSAREAICQFLSAREDEQRLVLTDYMGNEWPF